LGTALRERIKQDLEEKGQPPDYIVGSSALLRAQQTAYLMFFPKILWIIPYLSELYTSSLDVENQPADPKTQLTRLKQFGCWDEEDNFINPKKSDLRIDDEYYKPELSNGGNKGNTSKFMEWLGEMYEDFRKSNDKQPGTPLVFVTHDKFMRELAVQLATKSPELLNMLFRGNSNGRKDWKNAITNKIKNYSCIRLIVEPSGDTANVIGLSFFDYPVEPVDGVDPYSYEKDIDVKRECEIDTCRLQVCGRYSRNTCNNARTKLGIRANINAFRTKRNNNTRRRLSGPYNQLAVPTARPVVTGNLNESNNEGRPPFNATAANAARRVARESAAAKQKANYIAEQNALQKAEQVARNAQQKRATGYAATRYNPIFPVNGKSRTNSSSSNEYVVVENNS
jgi:hypothetical protein